MNRSGFVTALVFCLLLAGKSHAALQIGPPLWGFDGTVQHWSFNVLSVEVSNRGAQPFEGKLVLDSSGSGAPAAQPIYIAPGSSRWVQFFPYVGSYVPNWRLSWDDGRAQTEDLGQPKTGPPTVVILADPNAPGMRAVRMRLFQENLFPTAVGATDGLSAVVLDHQPHWEAPRREAFLDWVRRGGIVHLLPGGDGAVPQFTDDLAVLNITTGDRQRVGAGLVAKHSVSRSEITEQWLKEHGFPQPEVRNDGKGNVNDLDSFSFNKLGAITRPNINWALIYGLTLLYVVLIGPVFYLLRKRNYRLLLAGFLGTVILFAWVFTVIGRRGYGEKQIYHTLAIARPLGGGKFDVHEWIHAFATTGDIYRFEHAGSGHLYGTASFEENVRGEVVTGRESHFSADIPLFSSRPFLHRGAMKTADPRLKVEQWVTKDNAAALKALRVSASPEFRKNVFTAILEHDGRYSDLAMTGEGFELLAGTQAKSTGEYFAQTTYYDYGRGYYGDYGDEATIIGTLRSLHPLFICFANGEGAYFRRYLAMPPRSTGQARLFLYAEGPPEFGMKSDRFQRGQSLVLYVMDIFKP